MNVATRSSALTPSRVSADARRSVLSPTSRYDARTGPSSVSVTTSLSPFTLRIRSNTIWSVSGWSCICPSSMRIEHHLQRLLGFEQLVALGRVGQRHAVRDDLPGLESAVADQID